MARSAWSGIISLGLVNLPAQLVALKAAIVDGSLAEQQARYEAERERLKESKSVIHHKISKAHYFLSPPRTAVLEPPEKNHISLSTELPLRDLNAVAVANEYVVIPTEGALHAFVLFIDALANTKRAEIGTIDMRGKPQVCALFVKDGTLRLDTLLNPSEISDDPQFLHRHLSDELLSLLEHFEERIAPKAKNAGKARRLRKAS